MRLKWKSHSICKNGNREEENEDAVYPLLANDSYLKKDKFSCAMADGATQSSFSRLWANLLVKESSQSNNFNQDIGRILASSQKTWREALSGKTLPWPVAIKVKQGAHTTLLWFHIWDQTENQQIEGNSHANYGWAANCIGDTCIFQFRAGKCLTKFPLTKSEQFSNTPDLLSSNHNNMRVLQKDHHVAGNWLTGDQFLLASDALAEWLIRRIEIGEDGWSILKENASSHIKFKGFISNLRIQAKIKNDDTTMVWISITK